jgi:hypothetical protein
LFHRGKKREECGSDLVQLREIEGTEVKFGRVLQVDRLSAAYGEDFRSSVQERLRQGISQAGMNARDENGVIVHDLPADNSVLVRRMRAPWAHVSNPKTQAPNPKQARNLKFQYLKLVPPSSQQSRDAPHRFLDIGIWDLFGIWDLRSGISSFHLVRPAAALGVPVAFQETSMVENLSATAAVSFIYGFGSAPVSITM